MAGVQRLLAGVIRTVIVDAASDDPATRAEALDWLSGTDYFTAPAALQLVRTAVDRPGLLHVPVGIVTDKFV
jgi:hypothetical protein